MVVQYIKTKKGMSAKTQDVDNLIVKATEPDSQEQEEHNDN